jgi:hypothetical protein
MLGRNTPTEEISSTCLKISYITILLDQITLRMMDTAIGEEYTQITAKVQFGKKLTSN